MLYKDSLKLIYADILQNRFTIVTFKLENKTYSYHLRYF